MKSQALQEMVKTINSDEKTRTRFQTDPESVISQFALNEEEKRAVLNMHAKFGLGIAGASKLDSSDPSPLVYWF